MCVAIVFVHEVQLVVWSSAALFSVVLSTYLARTMKTVHTDHTHSLQSKILDI